MNEAILRIQQLAEKADNLTIEHFGTALNVPDPKEWQRIRDVKFAELIVNECIHEIDFYPIPTNDGGTPFEQMVHTLMYVKCNIKEHFGVK